MVTSKQRISLMRIEMESMKKDIKKLKKDIKNYQSILTCDYIINGESYRLNQTISKLIKRNFALLGDSE